MKRHGKRIFWLLLFPVFLFSVSSFADEIEIPFGVRIEDFKKDCLTQDLDLYDKDNSHGFVENRASRIIVYTYRTATVQQLETIKECAFKNLRK